MNFSEIKAQLTDEDIVNILKYFYPDIEPTYFDGGMIFPTICHNLDIDEASRKLYYYNNTKLFFCYTHCDDSFDIFDLVKKMLVLRNLSSTSTDVYNIISSSCSISTVSFNNIDNSDDYLSLTSRFKKTHNKPVIPVYKECTLNLFEHSYPRDWIKEGISIDSMQKFGILMHPIKEQIIIPHRNLKGELVGIRVRNLNPDIIESGGKYMPVKIENKFYAHPLMYNLYGLFENQEALKKYKTAWILEGEKSVLKCDGWYHNKNLSVASCGDKINKVQINLLLGLGVQNIVICYDRMNDNNQQDEEYFNKLFGICQKYKEYANFSFIYDRKHILEYKQAPVDSGREVFEKLLREKVNV